MKMGCGKSATKNKMEQSRNQTMVMGQKIKIGDVNGVSVKGTEDIMGWNSSNWLR